MVVRYFGDIGTHHQDQYYGENREQTNETGCHGVYGKHFTRNRLDARKELPFEAKALMEYIQNEELLKVTMVLSCVFKLNTKISYIKKILITHNIKGQKQIPTRYAKKVSKVIN